MPTYEYACSACGEHLEVVQSFSDDALTECPACGGRLRKVFAPVGIVLKGSGFYKTDSRAPAAKAKDSGGTSGDQKGPGDAKSTDAKSTGSGSSTGGTGPSTESTAAAG